MDILDYYEREGESMKSMLISKRGQVFLFAAVAISGIILSLGSIANFAFANEESRDLEKLTMEVKRETGKIIDYEIHSPAFDDYVFLEDFILNFSKDLRDHDPNLNFMFIYGNSTEVFLKNYGSKVAQVCVNNNPTNCDDILGSTQSFESSIFYGTSFHPVSFNEDTPNLMWEKSFDQTDSGGNPLEHFNVTIFDETHIFNFGDSRQVIFVVQKEVGNENFVSIM